ncbi:MAG: hypothetical protein QXQ53_03780 [Candidatus Methanosuratincola sp.]
MELEYAEMTESEQGETLSQTKPHIHIDQLLAGVIARLFGLPPDLAEQYRREFGELVEIVGFDEAVMSSGLGEALNPNVRILIGAGILVLGAILYKRYGDRVDRNNRKREDIFAQAHATAGPEPAVSASWTSTRPEFERMWREMARDHTGAGAGEVEAEREGGVGPDAVDAGGGYADAGTGDAGGGEERRGDDRD